MEKGRLVAPLPNCNSRLHSRGKNEPFLRLDSGFRTSAGSRRGPAGLAGRGKRPRRGLRAAGLPDLRCAPATRGEGREAGSTGGGSVNRSSCEMRIEKCLPAKEKLNNETFLAKISVDVAEKRQEFT